MVNYCLFGQRQFAGRFQVRVIRPVLDFVVEQINENGEQQEINEREQNQRRENDIRLHDGGQTFRRPQHAINNPRLPSDFRREPAELIGDFRADHGENQNPQQPAPFVQRAVAEIQKSERRDGNQREANAHHAVEKLERRLHRRPVFRLEFVQPGDGRVKIIVRQKTQHVRRLRGRPPFRFFRPPSRASVSGALEVVW